MNPSLSIHGQPSRLRRLRNTSSGWEVSRRIVNNCGGARTDQVFPTKTLLMAEPSSIWSPGWIIQVLHRPFCMLAHESWCMQCQILTIQQILKDTTSVNRLSIKMDGSSMETWAGEEATIIIETRWAATVAKSMAIGYLMVRTDWPISKTSLANPPRMAVMLHDLRASRVGRSRGATQQIPSIHKRVSTIYSLVSIVLEIPQSNYGPILVRRYDLEHRTRWSWDTENTHLMLIPHACISQRVHAKTWTHLIEERKTTGCSDMQWAIFSSLYVYKYTWGFQASPSSDNLHPFTARK